MFPQDFLNVPTDDPNCVLLGLAPSHFNYERLNEAFRLIQDKGATLVAIHKAKYLKRKDGLALGPGTCNNVVLGTWLEVSWEHLVTCLDRKK